MPFIPGFGSASSSGCAETSHLFPTELFRLALFEWRLIVLDVNEVSASPADYVDFPPGLSLRQFRDVFCMDMFAHMFVYVYVYVYLLISVAECWHTCFNGTDYSHS